jgi:hypothetical protein
MGSMTTFNDLSAAEAPVSSTSKHNTEHLHANIILILLQAHGQVCMHTQSQCPWQLD